MSRKQALRRALAAAVGSGVITTGMLRDLEAELASEGYAVVRDAGCRKLPGAMGTEAALDYAQGWNACRAAMLGKAG